MPLLWYCKGREYAYGRLSVLLRVYGLQGSSQTQARGLLRSLLFRFRTLPADSTGAALCVSVKALADGTLPAPDGADNHPPCRYAFFDGHGQVVKPNGK
jgi:hypothetical protein